MVRCLGATRIALGFIQLDDLAVGGIGEKNATQPLPAGVTMELPGGDVVNGPAAHPTEASTLAETNLPACEACNMTLRYERWLQWKPWDGWRTQEPLWIIALLSIALSLLFWISAAVLIWLLSAPPRVELPAG